jgi:hypothetical protein
MRLRFHGKKGDASNFPTTKALQISRFPHEPLVIQFARTLPSADRRQDESASERHFSNHDIASRLTRAGRFASGGRC